MSNKFRSHQVLVVESYAVGSRLFIMLIESKIAHVNAQVNLAGKKYEHAHKHGTRTFVQFGRILRLHWDDTNSEKKKRYAYQVGLEKSISEITLYCRILV